MIKKDLKKSVRNKKVSNQVYQIQTGINGGTNQPEIRVKQYEGKRFGNVFLI